ncbi:MAG: DUF5034 domain-containing protein [Culturomica sp.]|jgi:hypothetical protein|nr:DUF5034 domain-containing protein [Culturomica sp.]
MKKLMILAALTAIVGGCDPSNENEWDGPVIPVSLKSIEAVHIDNSGEFPVVADSLVKKEAYMVGIKWIADNALTDDDDKFITGPIHKGEQLYGNMADRYSKAIVCLTPFNAGTPAGKYVSKYFKEIDRNYLPAGVNEGFVLLVAPDPGKHAFRVEYYDGEELTFFYETAPIEFY